MTEDRKGILAAALRTLPLAAVAAVAAAAAAPLTLPSAAPAASFSAPETTEVFVGPMQPPSFTLAHRFLLDGSERVLRAGETLAPLVGYRLDPDEGLLVLIRPLAAGDTLVVTYSWVPLGLPRDVAAVEPQEPTPADSTAMPRPAGSTGDWIARTVDENLVIGGAKTLAIEAGSNKDAAVEQSLRVSVTGRIGDDVRLTALLSDQNIPLQPEGNTQRLEELDEVLIRLDAPGGSATLGDFVARRENTAFGNFERRLSGAQGTARFGPGGARAVGATSRGSFRSAEFRGEEGKQGPYVLAGSGLNPSGVIVAGSERVWMDGRELARGETRDYVIDYSRGEIEFTNRRLVTEDSEIAVDFEVAEQDYRRNFYLGEGSYESEGGAVQWRTSIAAEVDGDDPVNLTLDETRRTELEQAGDQPVLVSGVECGDDGGDYVPVGDHFEYFKEAGADSGTCAVSFTFVGAAAGDYVRDRDLDTGLTFFRYVGPGLGDYAPGVLLSAPATSSVADLSVRLATESGFRLDADGAFSRSDRNRLSDLDDDDNEGAAGRAALAWDRQGVEAFGRSLRLRAETSFRGEQADFRALGRSRDVYLGEVWNFADTTRADESVSEIQASVEEEDRWKLGGSLGVLDRTERFRSTRRAGNAAWNGGRVRSATASLESVRRVDSGGAATVQGDLLRGRGELRTRFGAFEPAVTFWKEEREETTDGIVASGENDLEGGLELGFRPSSSLRTDVRFARRITETIQDQQWARLSAARTLEVRAEVQPARTFRSRLSWIRRDLDHVEGRPEADRSTTLTRADLTHENVGGLVGGEYVYETTSRFFSDLLQGPQAGSDPTLAVTASARIRLGGGAVRRREAEKSGAAHRWLRRIRAESLIRVEEETTSDDRAAIYRLDLSKFQDDSTTVFGKILVRQEVTLFPDETVFSLTGRWERIDTEDNRADPDRIELLVERTVLRARNRVGPRWTLETQATWEEDSRRNSATGENQFEVHRSEAREEVVFQPRPTARWSAILGFLTERNDANDARARGVTVGLTGSLAVLRQGRFRGELDWTHPLSFDGIDFGNRFRTRDRDQFEWRGSLDVRVSEWLNTSVSYSGRALDGAPTTHLARAEARALF